MPIAVYALAAGAFGIGMTEFVIMGLLLEVSQDLGVSIASAGLLISGYALGVVVGAPALTLLTDRWPRKKVLLAMMAIFIAGNAACALAESYGMLMAARIVTALSHGTFFGVGAVLAGKLAGSRKQGSAIAIVFTGLTLATVIGVPLGTWIGQASGWRTTFWAVCLIGVAAFITLVLLVPGKEKDTRHDNPGASRLAVLADPRILLGILTTVIGYAGVFMVFTYISPLLTTITGLPETAISPVLLVFGGGLVAGNLAGGRFADQWPRASIIATLLVLSLTLVTMGLVIHHPVSTIIVTGLFGAAAFATVPPLQAWLIGNAGGTAQSLASSINIAAFNLGNALGAWLGGSLIETGMSLDRLPFIASVIPAFATLVAILAIRLKPVPHKTGI